MLWPVLARHFRRKPSGRFQVPNAQDLETQPATSISPVSRGGRDRDAERVRGLFDGQAHEETKLDEIGLALVGGFESVERVVQCEQIDVRLVEPPVRCRSSRSVAGRHRLSPFACAVPGPRVSGASLRRPRRRNGRGCSTPAPLPPANRQPGGDTPHAREPSPATFAPASPAEASGPRAVAIRRRPVARAAPPPWDRPVR